jgi:hypothetical protein
MKWPNHAILYIYDERQKKGSQMKVHIVVWLAKSHKKLGPSHATSLDHGILVVMKVVVSKLNVKKA